MAPVAVTAFTSTTALGAGLATQAAALTARRSGLRRNDFGPQPLLPCWVGRVDGVEDVVLPDALQDWDCRNNRLAWLALQQDGMAQAVQAAAQRYGAERVAVIIGTSTSSIGASEEAYTRLVDDADGARFPEDLNRPIVHTPHSLGDFVQHATGLRG
ncbi:beta-ketoacyl-[acyl-carrier-protein] synthase II, partial [Xanthomonas oryzae pv. oryzae]